MANLHLFWDGGTAPTGWTTVSDAGGAFYNKLVRGNSTYGGTGGVTTHVHTPGIVSFSLPSTLNHSGGASTKSVSSSTHTHGIGTITDASVSNLPSYRSLRVIKCNTSGNPDTIPVGAIVIFDSSAMIGYTRYLAQDNYHIYCSTLAGSGGGSNTHRHGISGTTDTSPDYSTQNSSNVTYYLASYVHTHVASSPSGIYTDYANNEPPYIQAYLGKKDSDGNPTIGIIGMWNGSPPDEWTILSNVGGIFYQKVIKAANNYGTTGGASSHSHSNIGFTLKNASSKTMTTNDEVGEFASDIHTHDIVLSFAEANNISPYIDVIFARLDQVIQKFVSHNKYGII